MKDERSVRWDSLIIAVVGGDDREQEIARLAAGTGAQVRAFGFPLPGPAVRGLEMSQDAAQSMRGADFALFPVPGIAADGSLYAPECPGIIPDEALLAELGEDAHIILGSADERLRAAAGAFGIPLHEYEGDPELMLLRAPAIVEGALQKAIENTELTIHAASVAVVGQGNIGSQLTRTLVLLGARVHAAARNPVQRAAAYALGASPLPLEDLAALAPQLDMLFSTVPAPIVGRELLERLPAGTLVMDLAAPPGGVDLAAAEELGLTAVWARGLGRRAPVTVGSSQWTGIKRLIEDIERKRG
ncbi:MAG: serine carboxypeptidase [Actinomycetota bacterium]|nr:serine carboxypeptidase [Actinomycetota bacterium]